MGTFKYLLLKLFGTKEVLSQPKNSSTGNKSFYDIKMKALDGKEIDFSAYKGKNVLLVNTASECGYTAQYDELQKLHETHGGKITVLGFPADNFGGQEPGSNEEIGAFCRKNFGVNFQLFAKSDVVGKNKNELYRWLTSKEENGWNTEEPSWNFCKYLVNTKGELVKFYSSAVSPMSNDILNQLF